MTLRDRVLGRIREEREKAARATRGPWTVYDQSKDDGPNYRNHIGSADPLSDWVAQEVWSDADAAFIASARTLLPALLSEAQRQVEEHEPGVLRDADLCCGCADPTRPEDCPVVLAWARVFGEGE